MTMPFTLAFPHRDLHSLGAKWCSSNGLRAVHSRSQKLSRPAGTSRRAVRRKSVWIGKVGARDTRLWRRLDSYGLSSLPPLGVMAVRAHAGLPWSTEWQVSSVRRNVTVGDVPGCVYLSGYRDLAGREGCSLPWGRQVASPCPYRLWLVGIFRVFIK